ncbi:MAG: hypothetical protein A2275_03215 [Bacteroidetes bacterium RIFOXYA12_FULL_35_11]|nr:MAG: hypothetical protein A2X01_15875 [Bacteroidetes bacterium GWF2_35_48]OFY73282.1 MAG: hypothetical protein A2275_03215 [Bacteroidetes bacterium RIFOXYA12_FULL_35_11]OFY93777.1 MAG: hypothetical protein A2309_02435 [Bacteroidetes bacterium RIFOXYB2_FULL_35_7]HBX50807.1 hypothetical protein [Bacteroidales bacterium]
MKNNQNKLKNGLVEKVQTIITMLVVFIVMLSSQHIKAQGTAINATGAVADNSAILDVSSTSKGFLCPRMTTAERDLISSPANSLFIFNTTTKCFEAYYTSTSQWIPVACINCQLPGTFTATAASSITSTSFYTNWTASGAATEYFLDVSTNSSFSSFVSGYQNLSVGNVTTYNVTGLTCGGTTYYYRIRANNTCGTSANSNSITVTTSACVPICGSQVWAIANMNTGTRVNQSVTQAAGQKWCYNDVEANCTTYGGLYQWASAMNLPSTANSALQYGAGLPNCDPCGGSGIQGICPAGYHIPTDLEFSRYEYCIENTIAPTGTTTLASFQTIESWRGSTVAGVGPGDKMKVTSSSSPAWDGTNTSNFSALPAGYSTGGNSFSIGTHATFHTVTEYSASFAWLRYLYPTYIQSSRTWNNKTRGNSIRCLQN